MGQVVQDCLKDAGFSHGAINHVMGNMHLTNKELVNDVCLIKPWLEKLELQEFDIARIALNLSRHPVAKIVKFLAEMVVEKKIDVRSLNEVQIEELCEIAKSLAEKRGQSVLDVSAILNEQVEKPQSSGKVAKMRAASRIGNSFR